MSSPKSPYKSAGISAQRIFHGSPKKRKFKPMFTKVEWIRLFKGRKKRKKICPECCGRGMVRAKIFSRVLISCRCLEVK